MPVVAAPRLRAIDFQGELEHACALGCEREGIALEDATWAKLLTLAQGC